MSGRKGPVLLDITFNAQREEVDGRTVERWAAMEWGTVGSAPDIGDEMRKLAVLCKASRRPLVCLGGGAVWAASLDNFLKFLRKKKVPYVSTLMGAQGLEEDEMYLGMLGTYGRRSANWAVQNCDLLIVIGSRLDVRQTGALVDDFARNAKIVQVDIDPSQLNNRVIADLNILSDADAFMGRAASIDLPFGGTENWVSTLAERKDKLDFDEYSPSELSPCSFFRIINELSSGKNIDFVSDVGNHQMWTANLLRLGPGQRVHFSGGLGAMGFGLPASIGVAMKTGEKVVNITGDGSVQMNIQELDTLRRLDLDVCVTVLNNASLGMVKNFQDMYFEGNNQSTVVGYSNPDFVAVARGYGLKSWRVDSVEGFRKAYLEALEHHHPSLIEVMIKDGHECKPRLAFGGKLDEQYPIVDR
jgi:acetolactate synthase-1/2/3 large subunit